jgi:hypothetical protein
VQQDVDGVESRRPPSEEAAVEGQGGDDDRTIEAGAERRAVPEMMREGGQGAPRFRQEPVLDHEPLIVEDEAEGEGVNVHRRRQ